MLYELFSSINSKEPNNITKINLNLPSSSFVEYPVYKIKNAEVLWVNNEYYKDKKIKTDNIESYILDNFSYVSESFTDKKNLDLADKKYLFADRYGNTGDAGNGGSARCGIEGNLQVKGNGINPLVAINVDEGHSTGKLPLSEAVSEAIWSEICHKELPYGSLRILAIIKTPETLIGANTFGDIVEQPCAIILREIATRPAHYEPALNFWPHPEFAHLRDSTHIYVKEAIKKLEEEAKNTYTNGNPIQLLIKEFVIRFATQIAASRVKGIPHGSLTSSNIALDGRFLDLGTISGIDNFSNVLLTSGLGATWDDHYSIVEWLENFFFYLNRHTENGLNPEERKSLISIFLSTLEEQENIYTALECGIPRENKNIIKIGKILKNNLRKGKEHVSRLSDCKFDRQSFEKEVYSSLCKAGYHNSMPSFKYRYLKFSRFTIFSSSILTGSCGSKVEINQFIKEYLK